MHVVDDIGSIGTLHVEIDLSLLQELCQIEKRGSYDDFALDLGARRELSRRIAHKIAITLFDLLMTDFRNDS
jgi:hypothetical protein